MQDVTIIVNPVAGSGHARELVTGFRARVRGAGYNCTIVTTTDADDLTRQVERHTAAGRLVAIGGGDGTIRAALVGVKLGSTAPLMLLPLGTENLLATQLGILPDLDLLWATFSAGRSTPFDLALVNGRPVATVIGAGFDAEVVARLAAERRGHITHLDYFWPLWRTFWEYKFPPIRVIADGEEISNEPALVFVGNIPRYAIGLQILREARWDDGKLDLCIMRCSHQGPLIGHAFWTFLNWHVEHPWVIYRQVERVRLESSEPLPMQCDGDPAGNLPADIEIIPAAVRFIVPPETAAAAATSLADRSADQSPPA